MEGLGGHYATTPGKLLITHMPLRAMHAREVLSAYLQTLGANGETTACSSTSLHYPSPEAASCMCSVSLTQQQTVVASCDTVEAQTTTLLVNNRGHPF